MIKSIIGVVAILTIFIAIFGLPPFTGGPNADYLKAENTAEFRTEVRRHPNGIYEVSALTPMPGVTPEMVRWWFGDYMQTSEHYRRWHPTAHVWMDWENKHPGEYIGASHLVHEYITVGDLAKLRIQFMPPEKIIGDAEFQEDDVAICARAGLLEEPLYGGKMCHIVRSTDNGAEMLSRFWLGMVAKRDENEEVESIIDVLGNTYLARLLGVQKSGAIDLMNHATQEMGYLAEFLPELYAAEMNASHLRAE